MPDTLISAPSAAAGERDEDPLAPAGGVGLAAFHHGPGPGLPGAGRAGSFHAEVSVRGEGSTGRTDGIPR